MMKMKFNRAALASAAKSVVARMRGASKKKKAALAVGVIAGAAIGLDPDLVGGIIEYFITDNTLGN